MTAPYERLGTVTLGRGVLNTFERDHLMAPDGTGIRRDRLTHPGAVVVVPIGETGVWFIRQYRPAVRAWVWELPAGLREPGEGPQEAAARECKEEVGLEPGRLVHLGRLFTSPGILDERADVYLATDLRRVGRSPDDLEEHAAEVVEVGWDELGGLVAPGEPANALSIAALELARLTGAHPDIGRLLGETPSTDRR